ncbi:MAG: hypothetical protein CM1200mP10_18020 [Candidatus Neomarinimicrobiota bacterium]|nr:MAG: hypothetical protein CM1200mP10_18020 [Candidatus Neomarinimicrobiota bacterium]
MMFIYRNYWRKYGWNELRFIAVDQRNLGKKPTILILNQLHLFPCWANSVSNVDNRAQVKEGDTVLVWGSSSGVGSFGLQIAKEIGCNVIAPGGSTAKCKQASDLGADISLNHYKDDILGAVNDYTNGSGVDVVFEHSGASTWDVSIRFLVSMVGWLPVALPRGLKFLLIYVIYFSKNNPSRLNNGKRSSLDAVIELIKTDKIKP